MKWLNAVLNMLKLVGALLVFISSLGAGCYFANLERFRINDLNELKKAMIILKSEINYSGATLPEASGNIALRTNAPVGNIFGCFADGLNIRNAGSASDIWAESVSRNTAQAYFDGEDIERLLSFGKTLGYLDKQMQLNNIEILLGYIEEKTTLLADSSERNGKMYRSLGALGGLMIIILFIV